MAGDHGLFTPDDVCEVGISERTRRRRLTGGVWEEVQPRVLRHTATPLAWRGELRAACLSSPRFVVTGAVAAGLHGFPRGGDEVLEGTVLGGTPPRLRRIRVHQTRLLLAREVVDLPDGLRVTTTARTLLDLCRALPRSERITLVDDVLSARLAKPAQVHRDAARLCPGARELFLVHEITAPGAAHGFRSWLERESRRVFEREGVPEPVRTVPLVDRGRRLGTPDCVWYAERLVIELDGLRFHSGSARRKADQARQNRLVLAGWRVLRFTWYDVVHEPGRVADEILRALAAAGP